MDCKQECNCLNGGSCRATDGFCICAPGFMGIRCSESISNSPLNLRDFNFNLSSKVCPEGFYGDHCLSSCKCPTLNHVCDPVNGCVCKYGKINSFEF